MSALTARVSGSEMGQRRKRWPGRLIRSPMTEADARVLLHNWPGIGGLEAWIAGRRWKAAPGGWTVSGELQGWRFRIDVIAGGLRITTSALVIADPTVRVVTR